MQGYVVQGPMVVFFMEYAGLFGFRLLTVSKSEVAVSRAKTWTLRVLPRRPDTFLQRGCQ